MRSLAVAVLALLAGCATTSTQWAKPGATAQALEAELAACANDAEAAFPVTSRMVHGGWSTPPRRECMGPGNCVNLPGVAAPPKSVDDNEGPRQTAQNACMKARGWARG